MTQCNTCQPKIDNMESLDSVYTKIENFVSLSFLFPYRNYNIYIKNLPYALKTQNF